MSVGAGLVVLLVVAAAVWGVARLLRREASPAGQGPAVRRFFQYLLLYGLLWVAATGGAGLLGRLFDAGRTVGDGPAALARDTAFTVVGVPLAVLLAVWAWRAAQADPQEARSGPGRAYLVAASVTTLAMTMTALHDVLSWAARVGAYRGMSVASLLVWGAAWGGHKWADRRVVPRSEFTVHRLLGALIGLVTTAVGAAGLLGDALRLLLGLPARALLAGDVPAFVPAAVTLVVGLPVWVVYWVAPAAGYRRSPLWVGYLLLGGAATGLVTAVTATSLVLYDVLVWLAGDPAATTAAAHFAPVPGTLAVAIVGGAVWWYHRRVLRAEGEGADGETAAGGEVARDEARDEARRTYEYLMAGIGLGAAAVGLMLVVVAAIEAATRSAGAVTGAAHPVNTVLAAVTLLGVGGPVWWLFWRRGQRAAADEAGDERSSPARRVYVFVLFGVAGVAAVGALLAGFVIALQDLFEGALTGGTLRAVRYPVAVIVATGGVSAYHWAVYRADRQATAAWPLARQPGPRRALLVGPADPAVARSLQRRTGTQVRVWPRADDVGAPWSLDELADALATHAHAQDVVVVAEEQGIRVIPVARP